MRAKIQYSYATIFHATFCRTIELVGSKVKRTCALTLKKKNRNSYLYKCYICWVLCLFKIQSVSKIWFLSKCIKLGVFPKSCRSNIQPSENYSEQGRAQWKKAKQNAGLLFTETALQEEKVRLVTLKQNSVSDELILHTAQSDVGLKSYISDQLIKQGRAYLRQQNNNHKQRLRNLLLESQIHVPSYLNESGRSSLNLSSESISSHRHFTKKSKQKRANQSRNRRAPQLFKNYSKIVLTEGEEAILNKGLNFCPMRRKVNRTEVEVAFQGYARSCKWVEFWHSKKMEIVEEDTEGEELAINEDEVNIFKDPTVKTNFPRNHLCPAKLQEHLNAVHVGLIGAPLNNHPSNLTEPEWLGIKTLQEKQQKKQIIVKPNDKTGGCSVLDYDSYVQAMEAKLSETFMTKSGAIKPKYERVGKQDLEKGWQMVKEIVQEGAQCGYISEGDAALMVPESPKPGRLYGLVKDHKPVNADTGLPPPERGCFWIRL